MTKIRVFLGVLLTTLLTSCANAGTPILSMEAEGPIVVGQWAMMVITITPEESGSGALLEIQADDPDTVIETPLHENLMLVVGEPLMLRSRVQFNEVPPGRVARLQAILLTPDDERHITGLLVLATEGGATPYGPGTPLPGGGTEEPLEEVSPISRAVLSGGRGSEDHLLPATGPASS